MFKLERKIRKHPLLSAVIGGSSLAVLGLGTALLYYLRFGAGSADAKLIPDAIEARLDKVINALNRKFGKRWVNRGVTALQAGLSTVLPAPLVGLVEVVHHIEHLAEQNGWSGREKLEHAVQMV